jgi:hypothetical protein
MTDPTPPRSPKENGGPTERIKEAVALIAEYDRQFPSVPGDEGRPFHLARFAEGIVDIRELVDTLDDVLPYARLGALVVEGRSWPKRCNAMPGFTTNHPSRKDCKCWACRITAEAEKVNADG